MNRQTLTTRSVRRARHLLGALAGLWLLCATPAFAQDGDGAREKAKMEGFQPVKGAPDIEKVDASKLVVAAYAAIFFGVFGYVVYVVRSQSQLAKEMAELAAQVQRVDGEG